MSSRRGGRQARQERSNTNVLSVDLVELAGACDTAVLRRAISTRTRGLPRGDMERLIGLLAITGASLARRLNEIGEGPWVDEQLRAHRDPASAAIHVLLAATAEATGGS